MKNFLCASLLIIFANTFAENLNDSLYEFPLSNGIDVVLYENFNFPVVIVSVIYDTGALDAPKKFQGSIAEFAEKMLISAELKTKFIENGISYKVNVHEGYTELIAQMHPKNIKMFLGRIAEFSPEYSNSDYIKQQISLCDDINKINHSDTIENIQLGLLSKTTPALIPNKQNINCISSEDTARFMERYVSCNMRIVVCGAVSHRGLLKAMRNSICTMLMRRQITSKTLDKIEKKEVYIRNKHRNNALHFYYLLPGSFDKSRAYWCIFNELMEKFFHGEYAYADTVICGPCLFYGNTVQEVSLYPKSDVPLEQSEKLYKAFTVKILHEPLDKNFLLSVAEKAENELQFIKTDLMQAYEIIREYSLNKRNIKNAFSCAEEISNISPQEFKKTASAIIKKNNILKIIEKYRDDR